MSIGSQPQHGGHRLWAAQVGQCQPEQILDFSANLNPLGPPDSIRRALQAALLPRDAVAMTTYPDPDSRQLRQALAQTYRLDPEWILVGNGLAELLTWAARDCTHLDRVVLPVPAFADYRRALQAFAVACVEVPFLQWSNPDARFSRSLLNLDLPSSSQALWVTNPHNPTGYLFTRADLLDLLPRFDLVVVDEAFMDFLPEGSAAVPSAPPTDPDSGLFTSQTLLPWIESFPQLVILRSLTKFFTIPGLRIGFAVGHPERLRRWQQWRDPWSVNGLATVAALAALQDREFVQQTHAWLPVARQHLRQGLQRLPGFYPFPSAANFLLVRLDQRGSDLQRVLLQKDQILIRDCLSFAELGDNYIRVAVRSIAEQERLLAACQNDPA